MPSSQAPLMEADALERRSASLSAGSGASSFSLPSPTSMSPSPVPTPMFRALALPAPEPSQLDGQDLLERRLPGYRRIVLPRELTLLDILKQSSGVTTDAEVMRLRSARLRVVAAAVSLRRLEVLAPRLRELLLDGSALASLREIGTGLRHLKVLHVNRCGLQTLDGLMGLSGLHELRATDNRISDIGPAATLHKVTTLDLSGNPVADTRRLWQLSACRRLRWLSLARTPAAGTGEAYRLAVCSTLPQLMMLDGEVLRPRRETEIYREEEIIFEQEFSDESLTISSRDDDNDLDFGCEDNDDVILEEESDDEYSDDEVKDKNCDNSDKSQLESKIAVPAVIADIDIQKMLNIDLNIKSTVQDTLIESTSSACSRREKHPENDNVLYEEDTEEQGVQVDGKTVSQRDKIIRTPQFRRDADRTLTSASFGTPRPSAVEKARARRRPASTPCGRVHARPITQKRPHTAHAIGLKDRNALGDNYGAIFGEVPSPLTSGRAIQGNLTLALRRAHVKKKSSVVKAWFDDENGDGLNGDALKSTLNRLRASVDLSPPKAPAMATPTAPLELGVAADLPEIPELNNWKECTNELRESINQEKSKTSSWAIPVEELLNPQVEIFETETYFKFLKKIDSLGISPEAAEDAEESGPGNNIPREVESNYEKLARIIGEEKLCDDNDDDIDPGDEMISSDRLLDMIRPPVARKLDGISCSSSSR